MKLLYNGSLYEQKQYIQSNIYVMLFFNADMYMFGSEDVSLMEINPFLLNKSL